MSLRGKLSLAATAVVAVVGALVWLLAFSPVFAVRSVQVTGTKLLTAAQVTAAAQVPDGRPLLRLDTSAVRARVAALPQVRSVSVSTRWPNGVLIAVTERVAVGYVADGAVYRLVDAGGKQYAQLKARPTQYPQLLLPGGTGSDGSAVAAAIAAVAAALPQRLQARVATISALDADSVSLALDDGRQVRWGDAQRNADKAKVLTALLAQRGVRTVSSIDVTNPDLPYTH